MGRAPSRYYIYGAALVVAAVLVALTGGLVSPWLIALAPIVFAASWIEGPGPGSILGLGVLAVLSAIVGGSSTSITAGALRAADLSIAAVAASGLLGSARWLPRSMRPFSLAERDRWDENLADISQAVNSCELLQAAADLIVIGLDDFIKAPVRAVLLYDRASGRLRVVSVSGASELFSQEAVIVVHESDVGRCLTSGSSVVCADTRSSGIGRLFFNDPALSYALVPLRVMAGLVGALYLSWPTSQVLTDSEMERLEKLAATVAPALHRLRIADELEEMALSDSLTGLYNRRLFERRLQEEVGRVARQHECLSLFMIDMNDFKAVNDTYGHPVGDQVLRAAAQGIRESCRVTDIPVRYGGDEFSIICPGLQLDNAFEAAERIRSGIQISVDAKTGLEVIASVGIACYPDTTIDPDTLTAQADRALYSAKTAGLSVCEAPRLSRTGRKRYDCAAAQDQSRDETAELESELNSSS